MTDQITETLLVVYDSPAIRETLCLLDNYLCCNIINIDNPDETVPVIKSENPDMVLLCAMISKTRAYEVCYEIKYDHNFPNLPVVILALQDTPDTRRMAIEAGADGIWEISISKDDLVFRLRSLLQAKRLLKGKENYAEITQEKITEALSEHCELIQNLSNRLEQCERMLQDIASNFQDHDSNP
ncbi:MAG: response regulator [Planctomycetes bacterium]|nr:response regulator [Planctomycetota bacterium]